MELSTTTELIERPNLDACLYLLSQLNVDFINEHCCEDERKRFTYTNVKHTLQLFVEHQQLKITYKKSKDDEQELFRSYGNGIQGIPTAFRGLICNGIMTDYDMVNCHPSIVRNVCKKYDILCPYLENYCSNRKQLLDENKTTKIDILRSMNKRQRLKDTTPFMEMFDMEMKNIQKECIKKYPDLYEMAKKKNPKNTEGTFMSYMCMFYENKILNALMEQFPADYAVLMFDGFMVYGENPLDCNELSAFIKEKFDFEIDFVIKPHSTSIQIPEDWNAADIVEEEKPISDIVAVMRLLTVFPHWKYCCGTLYAFDEETGMWADDPTVHREILTKYACFPYNCSVKNMNSLLTLLPSKCRDNNWLKNNADSSLGKILFKNGWYDGTFHSEFDHNIVFFARIPFDYSPPDTEYMESIAERFFYAPLNPTDGEYLISCVANAFMGVRKKHILFGLGDSNGGKSQLTEMILGCVGGYGGVFNSASLCVNQNNADDAAKLRVWLLKRYLRIIISNEIKQSALIDSTTVKTIASGGKDTIEARTHHKEEENFIPHFTCFVLANDIPKFSIYDDAINNRVKVVSFDKVFVDNPTEPNHLKKDDTLSAESKTPAFQKAFIDLLLDRFPKPFVEPESVSKHKNVWIDETPNIAVRFFQDYEITDDLKDRVPSTEIQDWIKENKFEMSSVKLCRDLAKHFEKLGKQWVNKPAKHNGKMKQCIHKIRKIVETEEPDELDELA
jgi:hypothetical protein